MTEQVKCVPCALCRRQIEMIWKPEHASHRFYHADCYKTFKEKQ